MTAVAVVLSWKKEAATKGQASGKTTSAVDLLETLPVLLGIVIGGYSLSLRSGQVRFSSVVVHPFTQDDHSVRFWYVPSLRTTAWFDLWYIPSLRTTTWFDLWYIPSLRTTAWFDLWYIPSLRTTSRFGSWYVPSLRMTFGTGWQFQLVLSPRTAVNTFKVLSAPAGVNRSNPWFICVGNSGDAEGGTHENRMFGSRGIVAHCKQMANYK